MADYPVSSFLMHTDVFMAPANPMATIAILNKGITAVGLAQGMKEHLNTVEARYGGKVITIINQYCQFKDVRVHMDALRTEPPEVPD